MQKIKNKIKKIPLKLKSSICNQLKNSLADESFASKAEHNTKCIMIVNEKKGKVKSYNLAIQGLNANPHVH